MKANAKKFTVALEKKARKWPMAVLRDFIETADDLPEPDEAPEDTDERGASRVVARNAKDVKLTAEERSASARRAVQARWARRPQVTFMSTPTLRHAWTQNWHIGVGKLINYGWYGIPQLTQTSALTYTFVYPDTGSRKRS